MTLLSLLVFACPKKRRAADFVFSQDNPYTSAGLVKQSVDTCGDLSGIPAPCSSTSATPNSHPRPPLSQSPYPPLLESSAPPPQPTNDVASPALSSSSVESSALLNKQNKQNMIFCCGLSFYNSA